MKYFTKNLFWTDHRLGLLLLGLISGPLICSCTPVGTAIGASARAGIAIAEERSVRNVISDTALKLEVNKRLLESSFENLFWTVSITVFEGRILLTGRLDSEELRDQVNEIVWGIDGVKEVLNEVELLKDTNTVNPVRDKLIALTLRSKIISDQNILGINYKIAAYNRTIYLIGVAQTDVELDRVIEHARSVRYVRHLINFVLLVQDPRRYE